MFSQIYNYKLWADERTLNAIKHINQDKYPDSYSFVLQQINHMVIVEELFRSRLTNSLTTHKSTNTDVVPAFDNLESRLIESGKWYIDYVSNLKEENRKVSFTFADGKKGAMSENEILFHIANHGSYHRGNIAYALDLASIPQPIDGYGIYIHEKEPERRE